MAHPAANGLGERLWGALPERLEIGLPRRLVPGKLQAFLRPDDLALELVRVPHVGERRRACLLWPRTAAACVVDRVLGGDGLIGHTLGLREAEAGVLAYAVARACAELALPFQVCDVTDLGAEARTALGARPEARPASAAEAALAERFVEGAVWPFLVHTALGPLDLRVLLSEAEVQALERAYVLELALEDQLAPLSTPLCPGDVLLSDRWPLTVTTAGLEGRLWLQARGTTDRLSARLSAGQLEVTGPAPAGSEPGTLRLVIGEMPLAFAALSDLCAGRALPAPDLPSDPVRLFRGEELLAEGALVVHRGELGLRVHSIR